MHDSNTHLCPLCHTALKAIARYPNNVCSNCAARGTDKEGRLMAFGNVDMTGGYIAKYRDTGEVYERHGCYIEGIKCYANEAKFGGIVIEVKR